MKIIFTFCLFISFQILSAQNLQWIKDFYRLSNNSWSNDYGTIIDIKNTGDGIVLNGNIGYRIDIDPDPSVTNNISRSGKVANIPFLEKDFFVVKWDNDMKYVKHSQIKAFDNGSFDFMGIGVVNNTNKNLFYPYNSTSDTVQIDTNPKEINNLGSAIFNPRYYSALLIYNKAIDYQYSLRFKDPYNTNFIFEVETDKLGNTYVYGQYTDSLWIDGQLVISQNDGNKGFIAKLDYANALVWVKSFSIDVVRGASFPHQKSLKVINDSNAVLTFHLIKKFTFNYESNTPISMDTGVHVLLISTQTGDILDNAVYKPKPSYKGLSGYFKTINYQNKFAVCVTRSSQGSALGSEYVQFLSFWEISNSQILFKKGIVTDSIDGTDIATDQFGNLNLIGRIFGHQKLTETESLSDYMDVSSKKDNYFMANYTFDGALNSVLLSGIWVNGRSGSPTLFSDDKNTYASILIQASFSSNNVNFEPKVFAYGAKTNNDITLLIFKCSPHVNFLMDTANNYLALKNRSAYPATYKWYANNVLISTDRNYQINTRGNYTIKLVATNKCGSDSFEQNIVWRTNSLSALTARDIQVYPNPTNENLQINCLSGSNQIEHILVMDLLGKTVIDKSNIYNESKSLEVKQLQTGAYILRVFTNNGVLTTKFVKE